MRKAPVARSIATRTVVPHSDAVASPDPLEVGRRKLDVAAVETDEFAAGAAHGERVDVGGPWLAFNAEGRVRPRPAIEAVRHCSDDSLLRVRFRRHRGQGKRRKPGHDEMTVFPARFLPFQCFEIGRREAPQFKRGRPQAEAKDDARRFRRGVSPDMSAVRSGGGRADRGDPTRILRLGVLRLLADREGVAGGHEAKRAEHINLRHRDLVGDAAEVGCGTIGHRRPDAVPHLAASQWIVIFPSSSIWTDPSEQSAPVP